MYCPECGQKISGHAETCPRCHKPLPKIHQDAEPLTGGETSLPAEGQTRPPKGKTNVILFVIAGLIIVILLAALAFVLLLTKDSGTPVPSANVSSFADEFGRGQTVYAVPSNGLNLRDDSFAGGKIIAAFSQNDQMTILEKGREDTVNGLKNNWYRVEGKRGTGWVFGAHLTASKPELNTKPSASAAAASTDNTGNTASPGTIEVIGNTEETGNPGFMKSAYNKGQKVTVSPADGLNLRDSGDISGKKIAGLRQGTQLVILEAGEYHEINDVSDYWYKVDSPAGVGWVFGAYVKP
jgi:hypothetical protein